jgi:geranylgeranyl diphosphate synthase, type II
VIRPTREYLAELRALVEDALTRALPSTREAPPLVIDAMRYSLTAGGKRLRPVLALAAADAVAETRGTAIADARALAMPAAAALELIHTYSLVHDDLPAMDDDTLRRGRPTSHVVFGDGLAILAGDGLLTEAFLLLAEPRPLVAPDGPWADAATRLDATYVIARAAGAAGMVGGQAIDLHAAGKTPDSIDWPRALDGDALRDMHSRKTANLIRASAMAGGIMAGATPEQIAALARYGEEVGLAFQIVDDLLDVEGTDATLGKTAGKDAAAGKPTYPAVYGVEESRRLAEACIERAVASVAHMGGRLADIARVVIERTN